ncbi:MAG: DUF1549 domain-containing protein [Verrucomicrobia bacterium]|nr:DUF1549 domain-containing protein [Verrucomicrobiota bacterium]
MKSLSYFSFVLASSSVFAVEPDAAKLFHEQVAPILVKNCVECHNDVTTKGGLNMSTLADVLKGGDDGAALVPGKAAESAIYTMIVPESAGEKAEMPKKKPALSTAETDLIKRWIEMGAAWPQEIVLKEKPKGDITHWSLLPLKSSKLASIDEFIGEKLKEKNLTMNAPADARTFIRRASFDLTGLPPTPEEATSFEKEFSRDQTAAVKGLIDRLLASPRYGERWARHWLDVVRFAESHGFEMNRVRPNAWPYRDYVIRAFNEDKPYDQFVREQIAGDQLGTDEGTGFLVAGSWDQVKGQDPVLRANQRADEMHDLVSTTGSTFLGLMLHSHASNHEPNLPNACWWMMICRRQQSQMRSAACRLSSPRMASPSNTLRALNWARQQIRVMRHGCPISEKAIATGMRCRMPTRRISSHGIHVCQANNASGFRGLRGPRMRKMRATSSIWMATQTRRATSRKSPAWIKASLPTAAVRFQNRSAGAASSMLGRTR